MKKTKRKSRPSRTNRSVLRYIVELVPAYLVPKLAREHHIDARGFSAWSHVVSMLYAQLARATDLNEVCDALRLHLSDVFLLRAARPPAKNTLINASKTRDCSMSEQLYAAREKSGLAKILFISSTSFRIAATRAILPGLPLDGSR